MNQLRPLFATFGAMVALSSCAAPPASDSPTGYADASTHAEVHAAISASWRDHISAATRKDLKGVVAMYADDMIYVVPGQQEVRGRPALEQMETKSLATMDVLQATHTIHALRIFGDAAYEISTVEGPVRARGEPAKVFAFHFMAMWKRQADGDWRVQYMVGQP